MKLKITISKTKYLEIYAQMNRIRQFELTAEDLFMRGELPGFLHSCIGQEASAVGICAALNEDDYITTTHRGHGHVIAKGAEVKLMMAELFGKETGYCKGKGGSMHIISRKLGILGANGIVGGGIPIATGAGLSVQIRGSNQVVVCYFGDGASDEGSFHESINLASVYNLPVLYVCENNLYAESQRQECHQRVKNVADRAVAYGIESIIADGTDVMDVYEKALHAVEKLRNGQGPILFESKCYRWSGHYIGDPAVYRPVEEARQWRENKDPILLYKEYLITNNIADEAELTEIAAQEKQNIMDAVEFARNSKEPNTSAALEDVYSYETDYIP